MKRDMDVVRGIMLEVEASNDAISYANDAERIYHVQLMEEAGLVEAIVRKDHTARPYIARIARLTWDGHEFLDATRDPGVWEKIKTRAAAAGSWSFATMLEFGKAYAMENARQFLGGTGS